MNRNWSAVRERLRPRGGDGEGPRRGRLGSGHPRAADVLTGHRTGAGQRGVEGGRAVGVGRWCHRSAVEPEGVEVVVEVAHVELAAGHRHGPVGGRRELVGVEELAVGGVDHLEGVALAVADLPVHIGRGPDDGLLGLADPLDGPGARIVGPDGPTRPLAVDEAVAAGVVEGVVGEDARGDGAVTGGRAGAAHGDLTLPEGWAGAGAARLELGPLPGVEDAVLVGRADEQVPGRVGGQGGRGAPVRVGDGRFEGQLPAPLVGQGGRVDGHDGLALGLGVVVEGPGGGKDGGRGGRGVEGGRGPHPAAQLPVGHEVVGVDDGVGGQADLEELALDQRVVAVGGHPDVGHTVVDEGAGPVVVGPGLGVVTGVDAPLDGAGRGVEGVPVGAAPAHIDGAVDHTGRRGDPDGGGVAPRVGGDPQARALPDLRAGGRVDGVLVTVPGAEVGGRAHDGGGHGHRSAGLEGPLLLEVVRR